MPNKGSLIIQETRININIPLHCTSTCSTIMCLWLVANIFHLETFRDFMNKLVLIMAYRMQSLSNFFWDFMSNQIWINLSMLHSLMEDWITRKIDGSLITPQVVGFGLWNPSSCIDSLITTRVRRIWMMESNLLHWIF